MALDALDPFDVRRRVGFLMDARRALLPLPLLDRREPVPTDVLPPFERRPAAALRGKRVGVVGSAGSGAAVAMAGMARAFEEAGVRPAAISTCSGSTLWGAMWAAGLTADEMVEFSLSWRPQDYLDVSWTRLPQLALSALRGFSGLATAQALEQLFDRRLWHMSAGETEIPLHTAVYNLDRGRLEYFGSEATPDLTLGELVRIAAAQPPFESAVRVEGEMYADGAAVDAFPAEPLVEARGFDRVFGLNVGLPRGLDADPGASWERSRQVELARRSRRRLGRKLTLVEPVEPEAPSGWAFHDLLFDRGRWPELIRLGHQATVAALEPFRRSTSRRRSARPA